MKNIFFGPVAALGIAFGGAVAAREFISIGTGGVTGVHHPTGGAIRRLVNKDREKHGIRRAVESTGDSVHNINTIKAGELELGVAQSDRQFHAYNGTSKFKGDAALAGIRAVMSVHPEAFTLLVRADSGIRNFEDLKGKRVNVRNPGSGQRATLEVVMDAFGIGMDDFALATEYNGSEMAKHLCDGNIGAMIHTIGHPETALKEATTTCDMDLVDVVGRPISRLVKDNPHYRVATIPGGMCAGNSQDTTTFGVGATFVTSKDVPDNIVHIVARAVMENIDDFKKLHPAFADLYPAQMVSDGLSASLHPGAESAYRESGLIK